MSASLVGSEMCIRDRSCPRTQAWRRRCCAKDNNRAQPHGLQHSDNSALSCLLYTSDAADDM
eukprot:2886209-Alexandrium_andersonii.AAC.1